MCGHEQTHVVRCGILAIQAAIAGDFDAVVVAECAGGTKRGFRSCPATRRPQNWAGLTVWRREGVAVCPTRRRVDPLACPLRGDWIGDVHATRELHLHLHLHITVEAHPQLTALGDPRHFSPLRWRLQRTPACINRPRRKPRHHQRQTAPRWTPPRRPHRA